MPTRESGHPEVQENTLEPNDGSRLDATLLKLSACIRRHEWLGAVYRSMPARLRMKVLHASASRARRRASFVKTAAWNRPPAATAPPALVPVPSAFPDAAGVNIYGYFRGQFGLGEGARLYAQALIELGYPVALQDVDLKIPHGLDDQTLEARLGTDAPYNLHLILVNPDYFEEALLKIGKARLQGGYVIACWFWELERIPDEWLEAVAMVDEIMVASSYVERAFRRVTDKPILLVALPVGEPENGGLARADFGLADDAFVFLSTFDFNSSIARKNPFAAIDAFKRAFPPARHDVQLLIKSSNGHRYPGPFLQLLEAAAGDARIVVRDEVIDRAHLHDLQRCADAGISLHRAEGFGLGLAECMRMGKPVVATKWSGNTDFMTPENSCLVDYQLVPVAIGEYPHFEGQKWAEASTTSAAAHMLRLVDEPGYAARLGAQASLDIRALLSPRVAASQLAGRLEALRSAHASRATTQHSETE